jgi:dihydrofolate synthase/folylpolyglutamate synthase
MKRLGDADAERSNRRLSWDPDSYLDSLEPVGWRLGLERMRKLSTLLGMPQHRFATIHVVGTNGKSSVTRMTAALLQAHGLRAGACVSPHASRWSERTLVGGEEIDPAAWTAAVEQVARVAEAVDRSLEEGEHVTQFEVATAASFLALAQARVQVAVVEAGLGGRLDATNTIPSKVTVLTSIGLDHTEWLGETELEIAAEKLAVLRDQTTLVVGSLPAAVAELAERTAAQHGSGFVVAPEDPGADLDVRAPGRFQRRNFALARTAAEAFLGELDPTRVAAVAAEVTVPGRLERIAERPPVFLDAAHNPDGALALAEALPALVDGRPLVACLAILADKDAEAMVRALAPVLERAVCTELPRRALEGHGRPGARSRPAAELAALCRSVGLEVETESDFAAALRRGVQLAEGPPEGALLIGGSHYAIAPARSVIASIGAPGES